MAPSLNWGQSIAIAEPVHGSAPDIAGSGKANPLAAILSVALLLRYHWRAGLLADQLERAVESLLAEVSVAELGDQTTDIIERELLKRL
jgi:homoisocitrate dehydrogenase